MDAWTDERLDDLAAILRPLPAQMARNTEAIDRLTDETRLMREETREDFREMRREMHDGFSVLHRQFAMIGWTMSFSLIGAIVAVIISVA